MLPEAGLFVVITAVALGLTVMAAPTIQTKRAIATRGAVGVGGLVAIALVPTIDLAILVVLALGLVQAALPGTRDFALRLRAPVFAVGLIALGLIFLRVQGGEVLARLAAVAIVAGIAAVVGVLPYMHEFDPEEPITLSPVAWMAFIGPVLALVIMSRARGLLVNEAAPVGAMLIGLGLVNVVWGSVAAWRTENGMAAWRYSFMGDWGLALCGLGMTIADGQSAAMLILFSVVLGRLPLYVASRPAVREKTTTDRPINLIVAAFLAGSAPFAGFAARVLLLRGATQLYWPLALVLAIAMLLWLPGSLRLGRSLGLPRGWQALAVGIVVALNAIVGLYPRPLLALAGL
jgi:hypothetical protein